MGVRLGGDLNASTGYDETIYVLPIPVGNREVFETGLAILREWAGNALLTDADIEAERGVVLAELRSGHAAEERVRRQMLLRMFNGSRYAARLPIGTERSLRAMTPDVLRRFYRDWYRPDLQAVIVVGDVNVDEVERSIKALFADVPAVANPRPRPARFEIPPRTTLDALVVAEPELPSGHVDLTQYLRPQPSLATVGAYEALLEDQLVNRMLGMRLYELTDRPVRPFLAAQAQRSPIVRGYEAFVASAAIAGQDPVETARLLATEIERARRFGFTIEELDAAKRDVMNRYAQAAAEGDKSESGSLADELGRHFLTDEPVPGIAWEYERVKQFVPGRTLEAVNDHARIVLEEPGSQPFVMVAAPSVGGATDAALRRVVSEVLQAKIEPYRGIKVDAQLLDREPQPGRLLSETADAALGTTTLAFANGTRVVLKPTDFKNDEVLLSAARYGGQYLYDQPDHQNAVHLVGTIEAMGYGALTPTSLQRFLNTRRADASVEFAPYTEEVEGGATGDDVHTLLQLVYLKLTSPRLDTARFESTRAALKGYLASMSNSPQRQFEDFTMGVLSQDHPRARRVPKPGDLDLVNAERSVAMYRDRFGNAAGMTFVLVGSFSIPEVKPLVARYLGGLPSIAARGAFPGCRRAVPVRRHRPQPAEGVGQQRRDRHLQRSAPLLRRCGAQARRACRSAAPARRRPYPRGARHLVFARRRQPVRQGARRRVRAPVLGGVLPRRGGHRRANHRRDHQGIAGEWADGRGTREGHSHLAQRVRRPHEDEPVPGQVASALVRWIRPWTPTRTTSRA